MLSQQKLKSIIAAFILTPFLVSCSQTKPTIPVKTVSEVPGNCYLDSQRRTPSSVQLDGWAFGSASELPQAIIIKLQNMGNSQEFRIKKLIARQDVADAFKNPNLKQTGFSISVPASSSPPGSKITIVSESASGVVHECKNSFVIK